MTKQNLNWYRLDNSAKIYPMLITRYTQSMFRLSIYLKEDVIENILNQALIDIMPRFPSFNVKLRRGLFWYFLEENTSEPKVFEDDGIVLKKINSRLNNHFLFTVIYYKSRVSIEFFHAVTDGIAGSEFLKALAFRYYQLQGYDLQPDDSIIHLDKPLDYGELEDSFTKNYIKSSIRELSKGSSSALSTKSAFKITGSYYDLPGYSIIEGIVPSINLLSVAREKGMTVTTYLGAAFLYSVFKNYSYKKFKPLTLFIPINLRKLFNSNTLRNFVLFSRAGIRDRNDDKQLTFDDFANAIQEDLSDDLDITKLQDKINSLVHIERIFVMRILPLPLKYLFFKIGKLFVRKNTHTAILSNLGKISIPKSLEPLIDGMAININIAKHIPISIGVASAVGKTRIMFTSMIREKDIIRDFFKILRQDNIHVEVISNLREDPNYVL